MGRGFVIGFLTASVLWGVVAALVLVGPYKGLLVVQDAAPESAGDAGADAADGGGRRVARKRRGRLRRRRRRHRPRRRAEQPVEREPEDRIASVGDDLDETSPREVDLSATGGEERLSPAQIHATFGRHMNAIRRCLLLLDSDQSGRGRVSFGMRVAGDGHVRAVRLTGPTSLVTGPVGGCLRQRAQRMVFPSFDGSETTFTYPITFE